MWSAVSSPSRTWRGTTMHSWEGEKGSWRFTTRRPSDATDATCRYLFSSLTLVSFLDGLVPYTRWEWVRRRSGHSDCIASQAGLLVKGSRTFPSRTSWTDDIRTTDSLLRMMKEHTWQDSSSQGGGGGRSGLRSQMGELQNLRHAWQRLGTGWQQTRRLRREDLQRTHHGITSHMLAHKAYCQWERMCSQKIRQYRD